MEPAARWSRQCAPRVTTRYANGAWGPKERWQQDWRGRGMGPTRSVSAGRDYRALGRSPRDGHCHDRGPLHAGPHRVLDAPAPCTSRRAGAHALPSNIRSSRRQPEAAESAVFSFEAIPFVDPRYRPRVGCGSDGGRHNIKCCMSDASSPMGYAHELETLTCEGRIHYG
jgi:hypothetical protein